MKNQLLQWLLVIAIGVIIYLLIRDDGPVMENPAIQQHADTIAIKRRAIDSLLLRQYDLREKLQEDSLKNLRSKRVYEAKITKLENKLLEARQDVQPLIDSIPRLQEFVAAQDSVISAQGQFIDTLQDQAWDQAKLYQSMLDASEEKYRLSEEINHHLNETVGEYQKQDREHRKQKVGLKLATAVAFVLGVLVGK